MRRARSAGGAALSCLLLFAVPAPVAADSAVTWKSIRLADEESRAQFEERIYDPYLSFASPAAEAAYREREAARRRIDEQLKQQGAVHGAVAARLQNLLDQTIDAGCHGAGEPAPDAQECAAVSRPVRPVLSSR